MTPSIPDGVNYPPTPMENQIVPWKPEEHRNKRKSNERNTEPQGESGFQIVKLSTDEEPVDFEIGKERAIRVSHMMHVKFIYLLSELYKDCVLCVKEK